MQIDWRMAERELIDVLRQLGQRPKMCADHPGTARANGEWYVRVKGEMNITEVARRLADALADR